MEKRIAAMRRPSGLQKCKTPAPPSHRNQSRALVILSSSAWPLEIGAAIGALVSR